MPRYPPCSPCPVPYVVSPPVGLGLGASLMLLVLVERPLLNNVNIKQDTVAVSFVTSVRCGGGGVGICRFMIPFFTYVPIEVYFLLRIVRSLLFFLRIRVRPLMS